VFNNDFLNIFLALDQQENMRVVETVCRVLLSNFYCKKSCGLQSNSSDFCFGMRQKFSGVPGSWLPLRAYFRAGSGCKRLKNKYTLTVFARVYIAAH